MQTIETTPGHATRHDDERVTVGPIMVATDGTESSEPALASALRLTQRTGGTVYAVAVHQIMPVPVVELAGLPALVEADEGSREALRRQVESQVRRIAGDEHPAWTIIVREGEPATELSRAAFELHARALVIGVKHRHLADRVFGRETALRLLQRCRVPLLIVPAGFAHLPKRALFAVDFSAASFEAGRTAMHLFDSISDVLLAHVTPSPASSVYPYGSWREWLDEDTKRDFERAKAELALPPNINVETVTREGHAARELVDLARDVGMDLIVTGTRGAGLLDRLLIGSTARGIVHGADCAVLVVRTLHLNDPHPLVDTEREAIPREQWVTALAEFSKRNVGRRTTLEVDDPQMGAQTQERDYFLQGTAYDPNSRQVEIMVGDFEGTHRHLTRNIGEVQSIHILPGASGKDWVLRVAHGSGQTLLTLHR